MLAAGWIPSEQGTPELNGGFTAENHDHETSSLADFPPWLSNYPFGHLQIRIDFGLSLTYDNPKGVD
jgi:hypothetical protein